MNFIEELKRCKVIRMAGLYLVGAWLLVQVAGTVLPWFSVSASVLRGLVVVLAIGFVPAEQSLAHQLERSFALFERNRSGLSDAYYDWLWQTEDWSREARQHPAFQGFAKRIGLVDYWKQNRWPDLCSPTPENGPDAFQCR